MQDGETDGCLKAYRAWIVRQRLIVSDDRSAA
jgi:hypothetical protein